MAKKTITTKPATDNKAADPKKVILDELKKYVAEYNDAGDFAEFARMKKLDEQIAEKVSKYTEIREAETFAELLKAENPLKAAAEMLRFQTVKVKDEKLKTGGTVRVIDPEATKPIDALKLHNKAVDGIGVDKEWHYMIQRLNLELTARRAIELGLDPKKVRDSYAMDEVAKEFEGFCEDKATGKGKELNFKKANENLKANMQKCVDAMIGKGYTVTPQLVNYLLAIFTRKDNAKSLSVTAAKHQYMRQYMLEVCNAVMTGTEITLNYKAK